MSAQPVQLALSGQVGGSIAAQHPAEDSKMVGDTARKAQVRARRQVDCSPSRPLLLQKLQQLAVVGQMRHIQRY